MSDPSQIPNIHAPLPIQQGSSKNQPVDTEKFKREMQKVQAVDSSQEGQKRNKRNLSKQQEGDEEETQAQSTPVAGVFEELLKVSAKKPLDFTISDKGNLENLYQKLSSTSTETPYTSTAAPTAYDSSDFQQQVTNASSTESSEFFFIPSSSNDISSDAASENANFSNQQVSEIPPPDDSTPYTFTPTPSNNVQSSSTISEAAPNLNNELEPNISAPYWSTTSSNLPAQEESLTDQSIKSIAIPPNEKKEEKPSLTPTKKSTGLEKPEEIFLELPTIEKPELEKKPSFENLLTVEPALQKEALTQKKYEEKAIEKPSIAATSKISKPEEPSKSKELVKPKIPPLKSISAAPQVFAKPKEKKEELKKPEFIKESALLPSPPEIKKTNEPATTTKLSDKKEIPEAKYIEKKSILVKQPDHTKEEPKEPSVISKKEIQPTPHPALSELEEQKTAQAGPKISKPEKLESFEKKAPSKDKSFTYEDKEEPIFENPIKKPEYDIASGKQPSLLGEKETIEQQPEELMQITSPIKPTSKLGIEKSKEKISSVEQSAKKRTPIEDEETEEGSLIQTFLQNLPSTPAQEIPTYSRLTPETFELFQRMIGTMTIQKEGGVSTTIITINNPNSNFNNSQLILEHYDTAPHAFNVEFQGDTTQMNLFNDNITDLVAAIQQARLNYNVNIKRASLKPDHRIVERKQDTSKEKNQ